MFRVGKLSYWQKQDPQDKKKKKIRRDPDDDHDVGRAILDLKLRPHEEGLSVYRSDTEATGNDIGFLFATTVRRRPRDMDFVLIPDECLAEFTCAPTLSESGAPSLRALHHEIRGLELVADRRRLASAVLRHDNTKLVRIKERDVTARAKLLSTADEAYGALAGEWPTIVGDIPQTPPPAEHLEAAGAATSESRSPHRTVLFLAVLVVILALLAWLALAMG